MQQIFSLRHLPAAVCVCLFLTGCAISVPPPAEKPALPNWSSGVATPVAQNIEAFDTVWKRFGNQELIELLDLAKANNADVQIALQRLAQAKAIREGEDSSLWPRLDGILQASRSESENDNDVGGTQGVTLSLSYEVDLWKRYATSRNAAHFRENASRFDYLAVQQITRAATAQAYAETMALEDRLRIARDNLVVLQEVLSIVEARVNAGADTALELAQQQAEVARAEATVLSLSLQRSTSLHRLAVLVGQTPQVFGVRGSGLGSLQLPSLHIAHPVDLLTRRPDIQSSEALLESARLDVRVARAALYPGLGVGADASMLSRPASAPAELTSSLFVSLTSPLFDGGALRAAVAQAEAQHGELLAQYRGVVLLACQEVEDAMAGLASSEKQWEALKRATGASQQAYRLARHRFEAGAIDFQTLLDTQRGMLQAEDEQVQARLSQINSAIQWVKAMAGG